MKLIENNELFREINQEEATQINGGFRQDTIARFIDRVSGASGAFRFAPITDRLVARGQINALLQGGTKGQLDYLLGLANRLTRFQ